MVQVQVDLVFVVADLNERGAPQGEFLQIERLAGVGLGEPFRFAGTCRRRASPDVDHAKIYGRGCCVNHLHRLFGKVECGAPDFVSVIQLIEDPVQHRRVERAMPMNRDQFVVGGFVVHHLAMDPNLLLTV